VRNRVRVRVRVRIRVRDRVGPGSLIFAIAPFALRRIQKAFD